MKSLNVILRLVLTLAIACWAPVCLCRAAVAVETSTCCSHRSTDRGCCGVKDTPQPGHPCKHGSSCDCGKKDAYTSTTPEGFTPETPVVLLVLAWPPVFDVAMPRAVVSLAGPGPIIAAPQTSLLRQHCALVV